MNPRAYTNGFIPGETVVIDMPGTSFDGMETEVVRPKPTDILEVEDVLVKNPAAPGWVLRLYENCLVKAWDNGFASATGSGREMTDAAGAVLMR